ncbi:hypothetical protein BMUNKI379_21745 [Burkholderia multivorans]|nr:hypothetical protein BMUNKI379_21745 [Burkholderia multivorans]
MTIGDQFGAHIALPAPDGCKIFAGNERGVYDVHAIPLHEKVMRIALGSVTLNYEGDRVVPAIID